MIRMLLEEAQYHLAMGFMELYPKIFPQHEILSSYDHMARTVNWHLFTDHLGELFHSFHEAKGESTLVQVHSCFDPSIRKILPSYIALYRYKKYQSDHWKVPFYIGLYRSQSTKVPKFESVYRSHSTKDNIATIAIIGYKVPKFYSVYSVQAKKVLKVF